MEPAPSSLAPTETASVHDQSIAGAEPAVIEAEQIALSVSERNRRNRISGLPARDTMLLREVATLAAKELEWLTEWIERAGAPAPIVARAQSATNRVWEG